MAAVGMPISEARRTLADVVGGVVYGRERTVLTTSGKAAAVLVPTDEAALLALLDDVVDGFAAEDALDVWRRSGEVGPTTDELAAELGFDLG